jgi:hypothetical protein
VLLAVAVLGVALVVAGAALGWVAEGDGSRVATTVRVGGGWWLGR